MDDDKNTQQTMVQDANAAPELRAVAEAERSGDKAAEGDALRSARNELSAKLASAKADIEAVKDAAQRRGEPPPQISANLDINPDTMSANDIAMASPSVDMAKQQAGGQMTAEAGRSAMEAIAAIAGMGLIMKEASESNLGQLAYNANLPEQQKDKDLSAMLS